MFTVRYVTDGEEANALAAQILTWYSGLVGFDTETFHKKITTDPVDVIQVFVPWEYHPICYVFHVAMFEVGNHHKLRKLITSKRLLKACSAPENDIKWIWKKFGISLLSTLDIQSLATISGEKAVGLDSLAMKYIPGWESKDNSITTSNWHKRLSNQQLRYAANDAFASYQLAMHFCHGGFSAPACSNHVDNVEELYEGVVASLEGKPFQSAQILDALLKAKSEVEKNEEFVLKRACISIFAQWLRSNKIASVGNEEWTFVVT